MFGIDAERGFAITVLLAVTVLAAGCGRDAIDNGWTVGEDTGTQADTGPYTEGDTGPSIEPDSTTSCNGSRWKVSCVSSCGSDAIHAPECTGGAWSCPAGTQPRSECPSDTCLGPPPPGCVRSCGDESGVQQKCDESGSWVCPAGTFDRGDHCNKECEVETEATNLEGVSIRFPGTCRWSVEQVREGVEIPYEVVVEKPVGGVVPEPNDAGSCQRPGESGLIASATIHGDGQEWCRCDTGLCMEPNYDPRTLEPGTYRHTIEWEGHNWSGPSDYGAEKGDLFPPGSYEVTVSSTGERVYPDDGREKFRLEASLQIQLVD